MATFPHAKQIADIYAAEAKKRAAAAMRKEAKRLRESAKAEKRNKARKGSFIVPAKPRHKEFKINDNFYACRAWRELRYLALVTAAGKCQCCGAMAKDGTQLHVDHIQPRSRYPNLQLRLDNLQVLCADCNIGKGAWDETNWIQHFKSI